MDCTAIESGRVRSPVAARPPRVPNLNDPQPRRTNRDRDPLTIYYARTSDALERYLAREVTAPPELIADACSFAWCQFVRHQDEVDIEAGAFWWLVRTASREAWRLAKQARREVASGTSMDLPLASTSDDTAEVAEHRMLLREVDTLPARQRQLLLLQAAGYRNSEISLVTGDSSATVERQVGRARQRLRGR
jgi:RNA polymerase sigma factor (sigma-70 family)